MRRLWVNGAKQGLGALLALAAAMAGACFVGQLDETGKTCTDTCPSGLPCINGRCGGVPDATADGPAAGDDGGETGTGRDAASEQTPADAACDGCGQPIVLAPAPYGSNLVDDDASLYWFSAPGEYGSILRTDKSDGGTVVVVADAGSWPVGLAVDDTRVYWTTGAADGGLGGSVQAIGKNGQGFAVLATASNWHPSAIAVDSTSVYVDNPEATSTSAALISRIPKDGGAPVAMAASPGGTVATHRAESVVVAGNDLYFERSSLIFHLPTTCAEDAASCAPVQMLFGNPNPDYIYPYSLAVDGTGVYWTMMYYTSEYPCGTYVMPRDGGAATALIPHCGYGTAVDDGWVYAMSSGGDQLYAGLEDAGGHASAIASSFVAIPPIVADGAAIYWIDLYDATTGAMGRILKLSRP